jgi:hypothetical protein
VSGARNACGSTSGTRVVLGFFFNSSLTRPVLAGKELMRETHYTGVFNELHDSAQYHPTA